MKLAKPLARQWLILSVAAGCAFCLLVLGLRFYLGSQLQQQLLQRVPLQVQQQFMPLLAQSVWDVDPAMEQRLLQGIHSLDGVTEVSLLNSRGQVRLSLTKPLPASHRIELPVQSAGTGDQPLGTLRLSLSLRSLEYTLWQDIAQTLAALVLAMLLLTWLTRRYLHSQILAPLATLATRWQRPDHDVPQLAQNEIDQLDQTLQAYDKAGKVQLQHARQTCLELTQQRDHLSSLLAMRTAELEQLSRFHQMVSEMSSRLVQLDHADVEGEIAIALSRIGNLLDVDRCYLFRVTPSLRIRHTQEWCRTGIPSTAHQYENYPLHESAWFVPQLIKQQLVALSQLEDMPPEGHNERMRFAAHGIQSMAAATLSYQGQVLGFFGCDCVLQKRDWQDKELTLIRVFSEMLCHTLLQCQYRQAHDATRTALAVAHERLDAMVNIDGLTSLASRKTFQQQLLRAYKHARDSGQALSLLLVNIDLFCDYNACFGHVEGDHCLIRLADQLKQHFAQQSAVISRLNGDEFGILLPGTSADAAYSLAESLRQAIWQLGIPHISSSVSTCITVSVGIASLDPTQHDNANTLQEAAAHCLHQAKQLGRNRVISASHGYGAST
ncbi:sensor domain-containing diguanylate cyclase [Vogesella sp. DC21W]|uniref:diguanylate cyclase n=1 Tax=Vogesella aquatica TaxID=2984206 RepID=A0ABT5IWI7_9NEIS|nr:sensor domain-containing diguanylate cyclase [Vogesella aquatica]MDC7716933.1 sensor domain-containing diguanylate cyclase [Vogesella aquatica]